MLDYWRRLKAHPGVEIASLLSVAGGFAGLQSDIGFIGGELVMGVVVWTPVLITARTQPLPDPVQEISDE